MKSQRIRFFLRRFFRRRELEDDLQEELNSHLAMDVRERMERGEQPLQAQAAARRQFGNLGLVKDVARDNWGFGWLEQAMQDVRYALRTLRQAPLFTVALVLTLALGLGSTTAILSVVDAILLRPLPFSQPERLAMIWEIPPGSKKPNVVALNNFVAWKQRSRSFESMAAFFQLPMNLLGDGETEQVPGLAVTSEFFQVLGTPPLLGRVFRPAEYFRDEPKEVILTYGTWQRLFGGRMDVIGKRISINVSHHEIIGVMPPGFGLENYRADLYVPLAINFEEGRNYSVVGRLRENVTATAARADIAAIAIQTARENQNLNAGWSAMVISLLEQTVGNFRLILLVFFASVLLLLLIACANVANLLLMRGVRRSREISVRFALGAGTARIVRQLLVESVVLSGIGGILGIGFAWLALRLVIANVPPSASIPRLHEAALNPTIVCFGIVLSLATGILFGLAPAVQASKPDLVHALHESSRSVTSGRKMRRALVVVEIALSFILAAAAGLMIRSFVRLADVNPGFHAEHVLTARMLLLPVQKQEWRADAVDQMLQGIRALPGVIAAGSIGILPMEGTNAGTWYYPADRPEPAPNRRPGGDVSVITPGYFRTLGIPILEGRDFDEHDRPGAAQVAILNQSAARMLFPGEDPLGKRIKMDWDGTPPVEIIGIARDIRHSQLNTVPDPCLFLPNDQHPFPFSSLVIRTASDPGRLTAAVRRQIHAVDADQGVAEIESMQQMVADSIARPRLETCLLGAFGLVALTLACIGIYGVIAYSATQRSREIGIRMAIGADRNAVLVLILSEAVRLTAMGLLLGIAGALLLSRFLRTLLFETQPNDPGTFGLVIAVLTTAALVASYIPAEKAMRVDPAVVLREQ